MWRDPEAGRPLFELIYALGNSLDMDETLGELDQRLRPLLDYDAMTVWTPAGDRFEPAYAIGVDAPVLCRLEIVAGRGIVGAAARSTIRIGDPTAEPGYAGALRSVMAVPLVCGHSFAGVLALYHRRPDAFDEDHLAAVLRISEKVAAAVHNAQRYRELERLSSVDPATSLANERALFLRLDAELARCKRRDGSLAVLVCDFEGSTLRPEGFRSLGTKLRQSCREEDCVARMRDCFVFVLTDFPRRHAPEKEAAVERLLRDHGLQIRLAWAFYPDDGNYGDDLLAAAGSRVHASR
jgi:GAF domain-containing protein